MVESVLLHDEKSAIQALDGFLRGLKPPAQKITTQHLAPYRNRKPLAGWRLELQTEEILFPLILLAKEGYPYNLPELYLEGKNRCLEWPHVETDNRLCVVPTHATFNPGDPAGVAEYILSEAAQLLPALAAGQLDNDFINEFQSYWSLATGDQPHRITSIVSPDGPSRTICCWSGKISSLAADTPEQGAEWLSRFRNDDISPDSFKPGLFLWLDQPLTPDRYPRTSADIYRLAHEVNAHKELERLILDLPSSILVLIGFYTDSGPGFGAIRIRPSPQSATTNRGQRQSIEKGFRPGHTPERILLSRALGTAMTVKMLEVIRADKQWIHTRGGTELPVDNKRVGIIGCGSLGASIAILLAQAGYCLTLIDPDTLNWENVGRHALGGPDFIGNNKAKALAQRIQQHLPHLNIEAHAKNWHEVWAKSPDTLKECNILISTTGDWLAESALNKLSRTLSEFPDLIFGWSEPHAVAGHVLIIREMGGCLSCGMTADGLFLNPAVEWPEDDDSLMKQVPACGAFYQPFGPVDLSQIHSLIASATMDLLQERIKTSEHRIWFGDETRIKELGGEWADSWLQTESNPSSGNREVRKPWQISSTCPLCRK